MGATIWIGPTCLAFAAASTILWVSAHLSGVAATLRQSALAVGFAAVTSGFLTLLLLSLMTLFAPLLAAPVCALLWTLSIHHFLRIGYARSFLVLVVNGLGLMAAGILAVFVAVGLFTVLVR